MGPGPYTDVQNLTTPESRKSLSIMDNAIERST